MVLETKVINRNGNEVFNSEGEFLIRFNKKTLKLVFLACIIKMLQQQKTVGKMVGLYWRHCY